LGIIRFYNERKGFGFIAGEDRKEYFVHASGLEEGTILHDGDRVAFIAKKGDRGLNAVNVRIV
jgi:CspA family cold shock protein